MAAGQPRGDAAAARGAASRPPIWRARWAGLSLEPRRPARSRRRAGQAGRRARPRPRRCMARSPGALPRPVRPCWRSDSGSWRTPEPPRWPIRRRYGWTTAARSGPVTMANWMRTGRCVTTAGGCWRPMQLDYAQRYGVASLKIRHHAQLGYVIEAPAAAVEALRAFPELTLASGDGERCPVHRTGAVRPRPRASPRRPTGPAARERACVRTSGAEGTAPSPTRSRPAPTRSPCWMSRNPRRSWPSRGRGAGRWSPMTRSS